MRVSLLLPLVFLALGACVTESARPPQATTTTYVIPSPTTTYVSPPTTTYVAPGEPSTTTTTVRRTY
jgi:hypothetical protein